MGRKHQPQEGFQKGHPFYRGGEKEWFIKGMMPWNKGTKGLIKPNSGSIKKRERKGIKTEFKKGDKRSNGENNINWRGGKSPKYRIDHAPRPKSEQCEICGAIGKICFDHNHKTGEFRGWICMRCNFALGLVKDNTETLLAMINYLKK